MTVSHTAAATPAELALHHNFVESVGQLKRGLVRSCHYLLQVQNRKVHHVLGYNTIADYAAAEAGLTRDQCMSFLALARRLPVLPGIAVGLENGELSWSQAKLLCRAATPATEHDWIETARGLSVRALAEVVRRTVTPVAPKPIVRGGLVATGLPMPPTVEPPVSEPKAQFVTIVFHEGRFALWESWLAAARAGMPDAPLDELLVGALEQGGGTVSFRFVIQECATCRSAVVATSRGDLVVPRPLLARARCEAETQSPDGSLRRSVPPRLRRLVLSRDGFRCQADRCGRTQHLQVHHRIPVGEGGPTVPDNLVTLCSRCHRSLHEREESLKAAARDPVCRPGDP
jgi:hypothetical protein